MRTQIVAYTPDSRGRQTRLSARPLTLTSVSPTPGIFSLGLSNNRDGLLYLPAPTSPEKPLPLVLMLHGAGGHSQHSIGLLRGLADRHGFLVLAPDSRGSTWDVIRGDFGPDVAFIDRALEQVFARYAADKERVAIGGFSDGASYALSLGLMNGDLFSHILAFSPGFMAPASSEGKPRIFISHGTHDSVLPISRCSRRIVPRLRDAGYDVNYQEFDGPHTVPDAISAAAVEWFLEQRQE